MNIAPAPEWLKEWARDRKGKGKKPTKSLGRKKPTESLGRIPDHIKTRHRLGLAATDQEQDRKAELTSFANALAIIPAICNYEEWFEIGAGIYDYDPTDVGLWLFKSWSWQSEKHRDDSMSMCEEKWLEYEKNKGKEGLITKASIYFKATEIERLAALPNSNTATVTNTINGIPIPLPAQLAKGSPIRFPDLDHRGRPKPTCLNARVAIQGFGLSCEYDTFHQKFLIGGQHLGQWAGDITDDLVHVLRIITAERFKFDPGSQSVFDAAVQECMQHAYHPVIAYLDSLAWDRKPRLGSWLHTYMQADASPLTSEMGKLILLAAVRRVRQPGCKFDQILVLEGPEGRGKSLALETLAGRENFSDHAILTLDDRQQQEEVRGVWLYEISELTGIRKADIDRVKAFASRTIDRARPAYGRKRIDQPRTCVFVGTTNENRYLQSMTGNRRFWPVATAHIDVDGLARDRDQLWAEADYHIKAGASLGLQEKYWGDAALLQEDRRERDPWEDRIREVVPKTKFQTAYGYEWRVLSTDVLMGPMWLGIPPGNVTNTHYKRLSHVMHKLGWEGPTDILIKLDKKREEDKDEYKTFKGYKKVVE